MGNETMPLWILQPPDQAMRLCSRYCPKIPEQDLRPFARPDRHPSGGGSCAVQPDLGNEFRRIERYDPCQGDCGARSAARSFRRGGHLLQCPDDYQTASSLLHPGPGRGCHP